MNRRYILKKDETSCQMKYLIEIEKVFVQRSNELRNPLSGDELLKESITILNDLKEK